MRLRPSTPPADRTLGVAAKLFICTQIVTALLMLTVRWTAHGAWPTSALPFSWQMYSNVSEEFCDGSPRC